MGGLLSPEGIVDSAQYLVSWKWQRFCDQSVDSCHRALTHDPEVYRDPMTFKPERFLEIDGREPEMDPHTIVFGFGRRICPGRILADNTLYLSVAQSLTVFNITKAVENGHEVEVKPEFQAGVISHPVPWKFDIKPRSPDHEALILSVKVEHPWEQSDAPDLENI